MSVSVLRRRSFISGDMRETVLTVAIDVTDSVLQTGLHRIESVSATSFTSTPSQIGCTVSGGVVTFKTGGPEADVLVRIVGR